MKGEWMTEPNGSLTERDAAAAWARAYNTQDPSHLAPLLAEDVRYASQWVFDEIEGRSDYLEYLEGKLEAIRESGSAVCVELAETRPYPMYPNPPRDCAVVAQDGERFGTVLFETCGGLVTRVDMCQIPPPDTCACSGEYPGLIVVFGSRPAKDPEA